MENVQEVQEVQEANAELVEQAVWELDAPEVIYPLKVLGQTIYVHMRPYTAHEMKVLQAARATRMAVGAEYTDLKDAGKIEIVEFFWKHFVNLTGPAMTRKDKSGKTVPVTPIEAEQWIKAHPRFDIERTTVLGGYGGVAIKDPEEGWVCLLDLAEEHLVQVYQDVYVPALGREERVLMTHKLRAETEKDNRDYKTATEHIRVMQRTRETIRMMNYDIFEILYNQLVQEIEGMTVGGLPCTVEIKDDWIKLVPFWHKDFVLAEFFRGAQVKNVR